MFSLIYECVPLSQIYLLSQMALRVLHVCVGCHDRYPRTYLLPIFCRALSLDFDTCVHLLCPNVSHILLLIPVHSCRRQFNLCHSAVCFCYFVFKSLSSNRLLRAFHHLPQRVAAFSPLANSPPAISPAANNNIIKLYLNTVKSGTAVPFTGVYTH